MIRTTIIGYSASELTSYDRTIRNFLFRSDRQMICSISWFPSQSIDTLESFFHAFLTIWFRLITFDVSGSIYEDQDINTFFDIAK